MSATHHPLRTAAFVLALSSPSAVALSQGATPAQRGGPPGQDTPYILVAAFQSVDRTLGVQTADEVRRRVQSEHAAKELYVIPKQSISATLTASGYPPDTVLGPTDLMALSKQLHGEYVLDGTTTKTSSGLRLESRILSRTGQQMLSQPLPPVAGRDAGEVAKGVEHALSEALKGMPAYKLCANDLRAQKYGQAQKDARVGVTAYPNSSLNRLCLLSAFQADNAPPDSIISAANAVLAIDKTSQIALINLADAYMARGDSAKAVDTYIAIYHSDSTNAALAKSVIPPIAQSSAPEKALPMIDAMLKDDPADPELLRTKWFVQLRAKQYKHAIVTGGLLVKSDTGAATVDYFDRQIGAAQSDSNAAAEQTLASDAATKFPNEPRYQLLLARSYNKSGQMEKSLAAARYAAQIDPKNASAWQYALAAASALNQAETVMAIAHSAVAAGVDKGTVGGYLLASIGTAVKKAQESKSRDDWLTALASAESVDGFAPTPQSAYFVGVTSFSAAADLITEVQRLAKSKKKEELAHACANAKQAEDLLAKTMIDMPRGGPVDKDVAGKILSAVPQYSEYVTQVKKVFCK